MLENVEEFQTWGPVRKGKPVKKLSGQTFQKWLEQLQALGYVVEWRELVAADYRSAHHQKRFFLIASARAANRGRTHPRPQTARGQGGKKSHGAARAKS
jgi:DNA (cytosine-5)-methyltransferase 1